MLLIKLGTKNNGFYKDNVEKNYTELEKGRMPHLVLTILTELETEFPGNITGFCGRNFISRRLMRTDIADELKFDSNGYQVSLDLLLKDFKKAGLVQGYVGDRDYANVKITKLGKEFLIQNIKG